MTAPVAHVDPWLRWVYVPLLVWCWPSRLRACLTLSPQECRALAATLLDLAGEMERRQCEAGTREAVCATPAKPCDWKTAA